MQVEDVPRGSNRSRKEVVTPLVEHLFSSSQTAKYGPYQLEDEGVEIVEGMVYRYKVSDRSQNTRSLQVFHGLAGIAGQLWEQEVRALLRIGSLRHPALPQIAAGGYDEATNLAFVVTESAQYDLDAPNAIAFLRDRPTASLRQLWLLADALTLLHGQGLIHRNLLPSAVQVDFEGDDDERFHLRLARFEMSALISNLMRPVYADDRDREREKRQGLTDRQREALELVYCPPERLAGELETDRSDVFGLGILAWQIFVGELPIGSTSHQPGADRRWLESLRSEMSAEITRKGLPARMQDLLRGVLRADPRTRYSSTDVVNYITRHFDALLAPYESRENTAPYLVAAMPRESGPTVFGWRWIDHDPSEEVGRRELFDFLDWELRRGRLVYSPQGAEPFVHAGDPLSRREAKYVLLGRQGAWFCVPYRHRNRFGGLGDECPEILLIKYVAGRDRVHRLERQPFSRRLPKVELVAADAGDEILDRRRRGRPSWTSALEAVRTEDHKAEWQTDFERGLDWFLDYQGVELDARVFPYTLEEEKNGRYRLRYDEERDRRRIDRHRTPLFAFYALTRRLSFGDCLDDAVQDQNSDILHIHPDERDRPIYHRRSIVTFRKTLDDNLIEIQGTPAGGPVPSTGWVRPADDVGSFTALKRQRQTRPEVVESRSLLGQLNRPFTIAGFRHRWRGAGKGLRGGADSIIKDMLVSQPFYALHGPPGTGKTTVVAHAVEQFLRAEPGARILVAAQANAALDNLALRIRKQLAGSPCDFVAIRITSPSVERDEKVDPRLKDWTLLEKIPRLRNHIVSACGHRLERRVDPKEIRGILGRWKVAVETSQLELHDRIQRGANLVFSTCSGATKANVGAAGGFGLYDWVIVEEAAKAWTTELAIPLVRGVRWTLIGDHLQLRAHKVEQVEALLLNLAQSPDDELKRHGESLVKYEKVFNLFGSLFKDGRRASAGLRGGATEEPLGRLRLQFRMREPIARVVSRTFYSDPDEPNGPGQLETDPSTQRDSGVEVPEQLAGQALVWLDTAMVRDCEDEQTRNLGEVRVVEELLRQMRPNPALIQREGDQDPVAILTPYRRQIKAFQARSLAEGWNRRIWSVHEYQGREADVVVVSLVRDQNRGAAPHKNIGFLVSPEIVNVLMSRARRLLVVVGSFDHFRRSGSPFWRVLCDAVAEEGRVLAAVDVLKSLERLS